MEYGGSIFLRNSATYEYLPNDTVSCPRIPQNNVGFEVLTPMVMKSCIFWDITQDNSLKLNWRFGGTCSLHLRGRRISQARSQRESRWQAELFLASLILRSWRWRRHIPPKRWSTFSGLRGVMHQIIELIQKFIIFQYLMSLSEMELVVFYYIKKVTLWGSPIKNKTIV
jgi:hypothetical protein